MSALNRFNTPLSSLFKGRVLSKQTGVLQRACSSRGAPCHSLSAPARLTSCQFSARVAPRHFDTKRWYSDVLGEGKNPRRTTHDDAEESQESGRDSSDNSHLSTRSSESFTLDVLVSLLRQENAADICVIRVPEQIKYTEYFVVVSGVSPRHLRAMALYAIKVYKFLKKDRDPHVKIEGKDADDWMCIDFGNIVVHFMMPEVREVYELEKLWTLRSYDEQLKKIPAETLPEDFIYDIEVTK